MSISSAGTLLHYSLTDIAHDAASGWTLIGCILDATRDGIALGMDVQDGCLSEAQSTPAVPKHKVANGYDPGQLNLTLEHVIDDYELFQSWIKAATKLYFRFLDPDIRDTAGALTLASCAREKIHGWVTALSKVHPAGGGRMTYTVTIEVDTGVYTDPP